MNIMIEKLIFSFASSLYLCMDRANLINTLMIYFNLGFNYFRVSHYTFALSIIPQKDILIE